MTTIITMLTEMVTGLDHTSMKLWDLYTWVYTYEKIEGIMQYGLCMAIITAIVSTVGFISYKILSKRINSVQC